MGQFRSRSRTAPQETPVPQGTATYRPSRTNSVGQSATPLVPILEILDPVRNECIPVRQSHFRERLAVHDIFFFNEVVLEKDIGGQRVDLVRGERSGSKLGHVDGDGVP